MGLEQAEIRSIIEKAVSHKWGIPEFQRGFVWPPQKVRDLIDSLWRGYPVGSFLLWYGEYQESRSAEDAEIPNAWIIDGQQRTVALCLLFGRKPYWWEKDWNEALSHHDVRFNILAEGEPYFSLRTAAMRGAGEHAWVSVREILNADDNRLSEIVTNILQVLGLPSNKFGQLWMRLDSVRKIRDIIIPVVTVMLDLEDVTEIFARLNSAGTKVTEADIALALAASQNKGWVREKFLPFLKELEEAGYDIDPNILFRSCVGIGLKKARLKDVPKNYWKSNVMLESWFKTEKAWRLTISYLENKGILCTDILPAKNALIPLVILSDLHYDLFSTNRPFLWLLHATRVGRYSGSALTTLESDLHAIQNAKTGQEGLESIMAKMPQWQPFTKEDFLQDYRDRFLRLIMYLVMYNRKARDWVSRQRLGFHGSELLERFNPDWHHIFPRAYLRQNKIPEEKWDVFANIAVMSPSTNIKLGSKNPMGYLDRYNIDSELLAEQLIPRDRNILCIERYVEFLEIRAQSLADEANLFIQKLME